MKETMFKQTEIGEIPEDWEVTTLGNVVNVFDGTHQTPHYVDYGFAFYSVENVTADNFTHTKYISKEEYDFLTKSHKIEKNDVLMTRIGSIGVCKYVDWESKAAFYVSLALFKAKNPKSFCMKYLAFASNAKYFNDSVLLNSLQFAIPQKINLGEISKVMLALPPTVEEQERIAEALSDVDGLLRELDGVIAKKRAIKQGAMQELLTGKRRLEGFGGKMKATEIGDIPEDWDYIEIRKLGNLIKDNLNPQQYKNTDFYEYSMPAFDDGKLPVKCKGITMNSNRTCIKGEVLLFNKLNVRQKRVWYVENAKDNSLCSMEFLAFYSEIIDLRLLQEILLQDKVTNYFAGISKGTSNSQKRIAPSDFLDFKICIPSQKNEQKAIVTILSDMNMEIAALEAKRAKYEQVKQGMMLELLTGKIRLV